MATAGFVALVVCGLGVVGLVTDADVIAARGLGVFPGVVGTALGAVVFAASVLPLARVRAPFANAVWVGIAAALAYVIGTGTAAAVTGGDLAVAAAVAARLTTGWFGVTIALAGALAAAVALAMVRPRR